MSLGPWTAVRGAAAKVRGRSVAELRERAAQAVSAAFERRGWSRAIGEPSDQAFWHWIAPSTADEVRRDASLLHAHFIRTPRRFFVGALELQATADLLAANSPETVATTLRAADRVRRGLFDLLGYTGLSFGSPIDWHLDPTTGVHSPMEHWSRIRYLDPAVVGDHKVVWELNRHQHFMVLGRAYVLSGREEYADTFVEQITSWMDQNPPKQGVNWASSLEIAYRLIAWLWSLELFRNSPALTAALRLRMLKFLHVHACHLERFLSTYFSPNTHLTGEALGLFYAGTVLPEFRRADLWARRGWSILVEQIERQVHPDGVYFEQATYYHRYTADIYLHAVLLAEAAGRSIPPLMRQRVGALEDCLADLTRPDGSIPLIGDDDGGRLVALEERRCTDARAALGTAAAVFGPSRAASVFASLPGDMPGEIAWLAGPERASALASVVSHVPTSGSRVFRDGGFVVMRDGWHPKANFAVVDCGAHGIANCGHAHADALSIDLVANGAPLFVDPGTYNYTTSVEDRNYFRRSAAHNTLVVDDTSSSVPSGPFAWKTRTNGLLDTWWTSNSLNYLSASHRGYDSVSAGSVHQRRILFVKNAYWVIWDTIVTVQPHDVAVYFHTAVGTHVMSASGKQAWLAQDHDGSGGQTLFASFGTSDQPKWNTDWVSECYGRRERAPMCRLSSAGSGRHDFINVIVPSAVPHLTTVDELDTSGGFAIAVRRPGSIDIVALRTASELTVDSLSTDGEVTWMRRAEVSGATEALSIIDGRRAQCEDVLLEGSGVGSIEMRRTPQGWEREARESDALEVRWTIGAAARAQ